MVQVVTNSTTLEAVWSFASARPDAPALTGAGCRLSYLQLRDRIAAHSELLCRRGVQVLGLHADNSVDWVCLDLAAQRAGSVVVPLPPYSSAGQMRHMLDDTGADAVIVMDSAAEPFDEAGLERQALPIEGLSLYRLVPERARTALPRGTAKVSYTAGTTGEPRGACLPSMAMDSVASSLVQAIESLDLRRHLCLLPLATLLENVAGVYASLMCGAEVVLPSLQEIGWRGSASLNGQRLCESLRRADPHSVILVPEMLRMLLAARRAGEALPKSLRFCAVGGGHASVKLLNQAEQYGLPVFEEYGLTECSSVVSLNTPSTRRLGSVGQPLRHTRIRVDSNSEIRVSGATMSGYVGDNSCGSELEVATGDLGRIDGDGYLHVRGRRKQMFITSYGRSVAPDWVESEFDCAPSIEQIALFGEARPWNVAVVVARPGVTTEKVQADIDAVNAGLPDYARVGQWIFASEPFDTQNAMLTANGRTRRASVWNAYRARISACYDDCLGCFA